MAKVLLGWRCAAIVLDCCFSGGRTVSALVSCITGAFSSFGVNAFFLWAFEIFSSTRDSSMATSLATTGGGGLSSISAFRTLALDSAATVFAVLFLFVALTITSSPLLLAPLLLLVVEGAFNGLLGVKFGALDASLGIFSDIVTTSSSATFLGRPRFLISVDILTIMGTSRDSLVAEETTKRR